MNDFISSLSETTRQVGKAWVEALEELVRLTGATSETHIMVEETTPTGRIAWLQRPGVVRQQYPMAVLERSPLEDPQPAIHIRVLAALPRQSDGGQ